MTEEKRERIRPLKTLRAVLLGMILLAVAVLAGFFWGNRARTEEAPEISAVVLESRLASVSELASVSYQYTNMGQFENSGTFYGITIPFTTTRFLLTYDGTIKAGVDLSAARVSVLGSSVTVTLPQAKILSHELEEDSVEVFDERTSIFNPLTVKDFAAFQKEQKAVMEEKALQRGLLDQARQEAIESVRLLLESVLPEGAVLTVK